MNDKSKLNYTKWFLENYKRLGKKDFCPSDVLWNFLSCQWRYKLPEDFIKKYYYLLNFRELSTRKNFSEELLNAPELEHFWHYPTIIKNSDIITETMLNEYCKGYYNDAHLVRIVCMRTPLDLLVYYYTNSLSLREVISENSFWSFLSCRKDLTKEVIEENLVKLSLNILIIHSNFKKLYKKDKEFIEKVKVLSELRS